MQFEPQHRQSRADHRAERRAAQGALARLEELVESDHAAGLMDFEDDILREQVLQVDQHIFGAIGVEIEVIWGLFEIVRDEFDGGAVAISVDDVLLVDGVVQRLEIGLGFGGDQALFLIRNEDFLQMLRVVQHAHERVGSELFLQKVRLLHRNRAVVELFRKQNALGTRLAQEMPNRKDREGKQLIQVMLAMGLFDFEAEAFEALVGHCASDEGRVHIDLLPQNRVLQAQRGPSQVGRIGRVEELCD